MKPPPPLWEGVNRGWGGFNLQQGRRWCLGVEVKVHSTWEQGVQASAAAAVAGDPWGVGVTGQLLQMALEISLGELSPAFTRAVKHSLQLGVRETSVEILHDLGILIRIHTPAPIGIKLRGKR